MDFTAIRRKINGWNNGVMVIDPARDNLHGVHKVASVHNRLSPVKEGAGEMPAIVARGCFR